MFKKVGLTCALLLTSAGIIGHTDTASAADIQTDRISGKDRFEVATNISNSGWSTSSKTVILANYNTFADALAAAPLAYKYDAPILLTAPNKLTGQTKDEIKRLSPDQVIIIGGPGSVSDQVISEVKQVSANIAVDRIGGKDRFEVAHNIADKLGSSSKAVVVNGLKFPDALAIAPYAAKNGMPILLTTDNRIPAETKEALQGASETLIVGGEGSVSKSVEDQLASPNRIAGKDRYEVAANVIRVLNMPAEKAYLSNGLTFADALTGSVLAAKNNSPLLLTRPDTLPASTEKVVNEKGINDVTILGGTGSVREDIFTPLPAPEPEPKVADSTVKADAIVATAKKYMGTPYVWGGTTPSGFDCSGFIQYVYAKHGIGLPRTTTSMWSSGSTVSNPKVGDLVFFNTSGSGVSHAGIYLGNGQMIHASTSKGVTVSDVDSPYYWGPRYLGAKKVF
ncbi:cell wall-binding repeat-containing protein [Pseudalkalibacillus caeni]|uniref:N-acetylmuramoyl-L-alanine amidase n=1 Tax=Exobacillus caeni TaxID=2574798 RepID=A0A5R9F9Y7_9BACL|nr:cell wall-binding repeat-containing protein [Pseudalkalibacillus caeni]TLS38458.1 N-acetylmuramoyl-L-alanine amidase [Pseudalkalibacillus caeni]